jgi:hypothetical protein
MSTPTKKSVTIDLPKSRREGSSGIDSPTTTFIASPLTRKSSGLLSPSWSFFDDDLSDAVKKLDLDAHHHKHGVLLCAEQENEDVIELIRGDVVFKFTQ